MSIKQCKCSHKKRKSGGSISLNDLKEKLKGFKNRVSTRLSNLFRRKSSVKKNGGKRRKNSRR